MNINELLERIINDSEHANELLAMASGHFINGDIESLENLLESNPDSPIILQYIALYKSLSVFYNIDITRPVNQNVDVIKDIISNLESAVESLKNISSVF